MGQQKLLLLAGEQPGEPALFSEEPKYPRSDRAGFRRDVERCALALHYDHSTSIQGAVFQLDALLVEVHTEGVVLALRIRGLELQRDGSHRKAVIAAIKFKGNGPAVCLRE